MPAKLLTDTSIQAAIDKAKRAGGRRLELRDSNVSGLLLRITPKGSATWSLQYRRKGERMPVRMWLGTYPDLGLADARKKALETRTGIAKGVDPIEAKAAERAAKVAEEAKEVEQAARVTFGEVADEYLKGRIGKEKNRRKLGHMFTNAFGPLRPKAIADVTAEDAMAVHRKIVRRGAKAQAAHVFGYVRAVLNYAVEQGYIATAPALKGKVKTKSTPRDRILSVEELRVFWTRLNSASLPDDWKIILRLQLLLAPRIGEVAGIARHEVDVEARTWTLPGDVTKNKRPHIIALPPMARSIIAARMASTSNRLLFETKAGNPPDVKHIANALRVAQPHFGFTKPDGTPYPFKTHDLRRTVSTRLRELRVSFDVREAILGHTKAAVSTEANYNHADIMGEVREALTIWQAALEHIISGGDPFSASAADLDDIEARALRRFSAPNVVVRAS
jgi:integrase